MINTFEEKLAYEIGVKLAHQNYQEKEASWQAVKALGSGLKGVATGQGASMGQAFRQGVSQSGYTGAKNFKGVAKDIGQGLAKPWQQMYQTFGARRGVQAVNAAKADAAKAQEGIMAAARSGDPAKLQAAQQAVTKAQTNLTNVGKQYNVAGQYRGISGGKFNTMQANAQRGYIPRTPEGAVNWGQVGTMAAGAGLAGTGAYMAGNAAFGGGNTYNTINQVQPQVAPHQYYLNQLSNYFK